jgi:type IV conjugative transfer system protein TraL
MQNAKFPRYLSSPLQVLWFESDEIALIAICYTLGLLFGLIGWIMMVVVPYLYSRIKKNYPRGFLKHCLYFIGLLHLKGYPIFFEKEFLE